MSSYKIPEVKNVHYEKYLDQMPSMEGKVIAITGTTTGTGRAVCKALAMKGAHILALNRKSERATASSTAIRAAAPQGTVTDIACDLQSFDSVKAAVAEVEAATKGTGLDALVLNAGIMAMPDESTGDGYPKEMQTNHLSQFMLASKLFPLLQQGAARSGTARIVTHSSGARKNPNTPVNKEHYGKNGGKLGGDGNKWERYHQTKMANVLFMQALKDKLAEKGITNILCVSATPGLAATNLQHTTANNGGGMGLQTLMKLAQSGEDGSLPLLHCTVGADVESGDLWNPGKKGLMSFLIGDGLVGWPAKRDISKEQCTKPENKVACWEATEAAVGPFF